nr:MaoC family dehydratase [Nocardioides soli]
MIATDPTALPGLAGEPLGSTDWIEIDQARVDAFAEHTEDRQWIHVDPLRAATSPFGGPIAHGFLSLSLLSYFLGQLLEVRGSRMLVNYGLDRVRFPAPVPVGSRLRGVGGIASVTEVPGGHQLVLDITVEIEDAAKPACVAAFVVRVLS